MMHTSTPSADDDTPIDMPELIKDSDDDDADISHNQFQALAANSNMNLRQNMIVDSGASSHIVNTNTVFKNYQAFQLR